MVSLPIWLRTLAVFVFSWAGILSALFYFGTAQRYTSQENVSAQFPIAVVEAGRPALIEWQAYANDKNKYQMSLIANSSGGVFAINDSKSFSLKPMGKGVILLEVRAGLQRQFAQYHIDAGIVKPQQLRQIDANLLALASGLSLLISVVFFRFQRVRKSA